MIFIFVLIALGKESYRYFKITREIKDLEKKIEDLGKSYEELSRIKEFYQSEEFLEQEARQKLNLVKEGEKVIIVASGQENLESGSQPQSQPKIPNPKLWWKYFFGKNNG